MNLLKNRRILVTKSFEEAGLALSKLNDAGAEIFFFPTIKTVPVKDSAAIREMAKSFNDYDYIIFTSIHSVQYLAEIFKEHRLKIENQKFAAVGDSTKETAAEHGFGIEIIPEKFSAAGLIRKFSLLDISGKKILIPGSARSRTELREGLTALGARVNFVAIYDAVMNDSDSIKIKTGLVNDWQPECFIFTSPTSFSYYLKILKVENAGNYFANKTIAVIGYTTAHEIEKHGINVNIIPAKFTMEGIADAVIKYYRLSSNIA